MTTMPASLLLLGQRFTVEAVPADDQRLGPGDRPNMGLCDAKLQHIYIAADLGPDQARDTVLHEVIHALAKITAAVGFLSGAEEERIVMLLSPLLLDALRANPELVTYLTARS